MTDREYFELAIRAYRAKHPKATPEDINCELAEKMIEIENELLIVEAKHAKLQRKMTTLQGMLDANGWSADEAIFADNPPLASNGEHLKARTKRPRRAK